MHRRSAVTLLSIAGLGLWACADPATAPVQPSGPPAAARSLAAGAAYVSTNAAGGNEVVVLARAGDGTLAPAGRYPTGGAGTGAGLGSQGAVVLSDDGRWLLVVNAGSGELSAFAVERDGLRRTDVVPSGGAMPVSVTIHGDLAYVLNAAGAGSIAGFRLDDAGRLTPLAGSARPLSGAAVTGGAQVEFSPDGGLLVVTEKATNRIVTYVVGDDGRAGAPLPHPSAGQTPFGFAFDKRGTLVVSEAVGGAPGAGLTSSYRLASDGALAVVSGAVPNHATAPCWVVIGPNGRYAYVSNTGSGTISSYAIAPSGAIALAASAAGVTGGAPTDMALSHDGRYLYALDPTTGSLAAFRADAHGRLAGLDREMGLGSSPAGVAAR